MDLLEQARKKYHLNLGEEQFSPIIELSVALSLSYFNANLGENKKAPLILSFPDKNNASTWLSVSLLINFFFEDYVNQVDLQEVSTFKKHDKVEIFGTVAEIESIVNNKILLRFSDQGSIPVTKYISQINRSTKKTLNKYHLYASKKKEFKVNRNSISKILEPNDPVFINQNYLKSTILLITGNNNARHLRELFDKKEIYGENLTDIFLENKNIIIRKNLEPYKNVFDSGISDKDALFKEVLIDFLTNSEDIEEEIKNGLLESLHLDNYTNENFKLQFDSFLEFYSLKYEGLSKIKNLYPGVREKVSANIKAVIINEIEQVELYRTTIQGFLRCNIPVVIVVDRDIKKSADLDFFKEFIDKWPEAFRFNWSRDKIKKLATYCAPNSMFLDDELWKKCKHFSRQSIKITESKPEKLDNLLIESQSLIGTLNEFENLQQDYYKYLHPAMYLFKNSYNKSPIVNEWAALFDSTFQRSKPFLNNMQQGLFQSIINFLRFNEVNIKGRYDSEFVFVNILKTGNVKSIFIPTEQAQIQLPRENLEKLIFTGYPYHEFSGSYLIDAVNFYFIPEIKINCWPKEAQTTYLYLKRRLIAGHFTDRLTDNMVFDSGFVISDNTEFDKEVNEVLQLVKITGNENVAETTQDQEQTLQAVDSLKYKRYTTKNHAQNQARVKCDIINFNDGSFLFLPKNSKVLTQVESDDLTTKVKTSLFSELEVGSRIFKYRKDRSDFRDLARNDNRVKKAFSELELWKTLLVELFNSSDKDLSKLESLLMQVKAKDALPGNPNRGNIHRWLYDPELIAPEIENIKIILLAARFADFDNRIKILKDSYSLVIGHIISQSSQIRRSILKKLENSRTIEEDFNLIISDVEIAIQSRLISKLENTDFEVEYINTRQILI